MNKPGDQEWIDTVNTTERRIIDLRLIGMRHALALGRFRYVRAAQPLQEQRHDKWLVLQFVLSGQQLIIVDGKETLVRGGEMMRALPGQRYGTGAWREQRGEMAWLILRYQPMPRGPALGMSAEGIRAIYGMLADPAAPTVIPMPADAAGLLESAFGWWEQKDETIGREMIRNRINALVLGAAAMFAGSRPESSDQANELRIRKVLQWMDDHLESDANAEELAEIAGLSPARFHVHFKRVTGSSPKDYWQRLRVERAAQRLLRAPELTVTQVAHEFGFSSSQYFATVFRRYLGTSPQASRVAAVREARDTHGRTNLLAVAKRNREAAKK
jgi:AraC-like DNA-binding protein